MTRIKKNRTEKSIGAAKKPLLKQSERIKLNSKKKGKGRPSGAKANIDGATKKKTRSNSAASKADDHKVGSKKPIDLVVKTDAKDLQPRVSVKKTKQKPELSPEQQLERIENDTRLNDLLDRLDAQETLSDKDMAYIEHQTAHHQKLTKILGIEDDELEEEVEQQEAWQQIDSSEFDEFKQK